MMFNFRRRKKKRNNYTNEFQLPNRFFKKRETKTKKSSAQTEKKMY